MRKANLQLALLVFLAVTTFTCAQTPAADATDYKPTLTFDIASIRETGGVTGGGLKVGIKSPIHASSFEAANFTTKSLIQLAYGAGTPITGGPDWIGDRYYNFQAKSDPEADAKLAKLSDDDAKLEKQHALQVMLAERFNLKFHMETKDTSVFALTVAKGGSKLQPLKTGSADANPDQPAPSPSPVVDAHGGAQGLQFSARFFSTRAIVGLLTTQLEAPIVDRTGLTGYYNFTLQIGREWSASNPESWPDILTAVQEQLGLKLDRTRASVPVLIIDHIDKPTAN